MGLYVERPKRLILPRWRDFEITIKSDELNSLRVPDSSNRFRENISGKLELWLRNRTLIGAIKIVNQAFVGGVTDLAIEPARYVLNNSHKLASPILDISKKILRSNFSSNSKDVSISDHRLDDLKFLIGRKIKNLRKSLTSCPRNSVRWIELARWYLIVGKLKDAEKAIKVALQLAPNNRYVCRSAVRYYLHLGGEKNLTKAKNILTQNGISYKDPWLLSIHISMDSFLNRSQTNIKKGREIINSQNFSAFELTELNSAIATEELKSGKHTKSRSLFQDSLIDPNENSVAQADWATEYVGELDINYGINNAFEANAYKKYKEGDWEDAFKESCNWFLDQPFSSEPAKFGSYIAGSILDDNLKAIEISDFGLRSNPNDFTLLNNKAYSLAVEDKTKKALETFSKIDLSTLSENNKVVYKATNGMIEYQIGNSESGEKYYDDAILLAKKLNNPRLEAHAKFYKVRAQFLTKNNDVTQAIAFETLNKDLENHMSKEMKKKFQNLKNRILGSN